MFSVIEAGILGKVAKLQKCVIGHLSLDIHITSDAVMM